MGYIFERKINYYETDRMGVVHHSNYVRYLEEARCEWLEQVGMPFSALEEHNITIPVLGVSCIYKHHVTFEDTILVHARITEYTSVRMRVEYEVTDKKTGKLLLTAETRHCFTDKNLKPISLKKYAPEFHQKFENLVEKIES